MVPPLQSLLQQYSKKPANPITLHTGERWVHTNLFIELFKTRKKKHTASANILRSYE